MIMEVRIDWNYMLQGAVFPMQADRLPESVAGLVVEDFSYMEGMIAVH